MRWIVVVVMADLLRGRAIVGNRDTGALYAKIDGRLYHLPDSDQSGLAETLTKLQSGPGQLYLYDNFGAFTDRIVLLGLDIKMFYGGPKEAVMHSIYRQNYGFTDIIIGDNGFYPATPGYDYPTGWGVPRVTGLAIALALQNTLANIAAGIMLVWLRPIAVGEYIVGDGVEHTL